MPDTARWGAASKFGGLFADLVAGRYYGPGGLVGTTGALGNGTLRAAPIFVPNLIAITRIAVDITVAGSAGCTYRLGIYADDGSGEPGALTLDAGTVAADAVALQEIAINQLLDPGLYWLAGVIQGAPAVQPTLRSTFAQNQLLSFTNPANVSPNNAGFVCTGVVNGALPNPFTVLSVGGSAPRILIRP